MWRALAIIALASCGVGCDALFGLDRLHTTDADVRLDARVDAGVVPDATCVSGSATTTLLGARTGGTGQASMADTYIIQAHSMMNYGTAPTLALCNGCNASSSDPWDGSVSVVLLHFDTDAICPGSTITMAELLLDTTSDQLGSGDVGVFLLKEGFTEGDGNESGTSGEASWAKNKAGNAWKNAGADQPGSRDAVPLATFAPLVKLTPNIIPLQPATALQPWLTGSNFGLAIAITTGNSDVQFYSREASSIAQRPGLRVVTRAP